MNGELRPCAIAGRFSRARRIGNQRALRRVHNPQPPAERPLKAPPQGIVATGIEEEQLHVHPTLVHPGQHPIGCHRVVFDITGGTEPRANRHEVVHPINLHAMAGKEEQARTPARCAVRKEVDGLFHGGFVGIAVEGDVKAQAAQERGEVGGIVHRVGQGAVGIGGVANDQGAAGLGWSDRRDRRRARCRRWHRRGGAAVAS